jgi:hypothetical protein
MILTGRIDATGVLRPVTSNIYEPVLNELAKLSISCKERIETFYVFPRLE